MKSFYAAIVLLLALLPSVPAQVNVEVTLDKDEFLSGETLPVAVRITNRSGQALRLGSAADWLSFSVESSDGFVVAKSGNPAVTGAFVLESSEVATKRVEVASYFNLAQPGHYTITATLRIQQWQEQTVSPAKGFDIINGAKLWSQEFGVPPPAGVTNQPPEMRRYTLLESTPLRSQIKLYLRLSDATDNKIFKVFPIGPLPSFNQVEPQLDQFSNLHLLYQAGAHAFCYVVIGPYGDIILRQTYDYVNSRPRLQAGKDGRLTVIGGVRHPNATDLPPPAPEPETVKTPKG